MPKSYSESGYPLPEELILREKKPRKRQSSEPPSRKGRAGRTALFFALLIIIWQLAAYILTDLTHLVKGYILVTPIEVAQTLIRLTLDGGTLPRAIFISLRRLITGYALSVVLAIPLTLIMHARVFGAELRMLALGLQTLPNVCWIPFAILGFGLGEGSIIFVVVMGSAFSIATSSYSAIQSVSPVYTRAALTMGYSRLAVKLKVLLPAALPGVISALRSGWTFAWRALMAGEVLSASLGLGQLLTYGRELFDMSQIVGIMLIIMLVGIVFDKLIFGRIERHILQSRGLYNTEK